MEPSFIQHAETDSATQTLKVPPHSIEAEQAVLGGLMLDNDALLQVSETIIESDFYRHDHRLIFNSISMLAKDDKPYDVITLAEWLGQNDELNKAGGLVYLAALVDNTPSAVNLGAYAEIVRERSVLRQMIAVGTDIANSGFQPQGRKTSDLLDEAEKKVFEIADQSSRGNRGFVEIQKLLEGALDRIDTLFQSDSNITGISTGYQDLDNKTSGLQNSDLIIVAGRPSMGKTAFSVNIAEHAAIKEGRSVAIFSMEMPGEQLAMRLLSSLGRIDQHKIRTGNLADDDWPRLTSAVGILSEAKMFIDDTPALTPTEIRTRCRRISREHGLDLVLIDYLQLMQVSGGSENRATEISEISRSLKALAKELSIPVIALSQLNRSLEQRPNKRPVMSDLRESGAIEQDADVIMFIYRDEVYDEDSNDKGIAEIIIGKQRNGPIGSVRLAFLGQYTRFENLMPEYYNAEGPL